MPCSKKMRGDELLLLCPQNRRRPLLPDELKSSIHPPTELLAWRHFTAGTFYSCVGLRTLSGVRLGSSTSALLTFRGGIMCLVRWFASPLASTHSVPAAPPRLTCDNEKCVRTLIDVSCRAISSLVEVQNHQVEGSHK